MGLLLWIVYVAGDLTAVARVAFVVVLVVADLGVHNPGPLHPPWPSPTPGLDVRPENNVPLPVVAAHGIFAAATLAQVLVAAFPS